MVKKKKTIISKTEQFSNNLTQWIGTPQSILLHTLGFIGIFSLQYIGFSIDQILLILTTAVSLEAIYLAIFIQMTVNRNTKSLEEVEEDIDEIQEDVEELEEEFEDISDEIDELHEEETEEEQREKVTNQTLDKISTQLQTLVKEVEQLKKDNTTQ